MLEHVPYRLQLFIISTPLSRILFNLQQALSLQILIGLLVNHVST